MVELLVIKIGGNIIDDEAKLSSFLKLFAAIDGPKILVHGGGKLATQMAGKLNIPQKMVNGRRITDAETLKVITMVYAGYINKNIVAKLQSLHCNSIGLCGADGNTILAHKRIHPDIDYGFVGDIDSVNTSFLKTCLSNEMIPVIAPVTADKNGQLLNTNADTIAGEIAKAMSNLYEVELIFTFEKSGVLLDVNDDSSVIKRLDKNYYEQLKHPPSVSEGTKIFAGMIPKLDNAFAAFNSGVKQVRIGKAEELDHLITGTKGTLISNEP
ncbi:MAG: acetylglutamate kinase [Chitinophagaceae bacterium]|nr:acetylglutamate kinase [Chitinophagaceae bacterium]